MELFFDSNVLLKYMAGDEMAARIVEENSGYINSTVVSEVTYGYIRTITDMSPFDLKNRFATVNVDLEPVRTLLERFTEIPVPPASTILTVISKYKLLPKRCNNFSIHANGRNKKSGNIRCGLQKGQKHTVGS
ncbi:MAG: PIN domain-containing protein [Candidatus Diapherotrites archaeon]|nr:PIN domain-containing protein [Candidatus Diapherotrites archaeon]